MKYILNSLIILSVYLYIIMPRLKRSIIKTFLDVRFAHRGLHGKNTPENSLASFSRAVEGGVGIELDLQLTKDGKVVVFHDDDLSRVCGSKKRIKDLTFEQLREYKLFGSNQTIPSFAEVLSLVAGRVPLLIELKTNSILFGFKICRETVKQLNGYQGSYCVESFNPLYLVWFRIKRRNIARGLLMCRFPYEEHKRFFPIILLMRMMIFNVFARPDFIAYDYSHRQLLSLKLHRFIFRTPIFAWTVPGKLLKSQKLNKYHSFIFEEK